MKDDFSELETGADCYVISNATSIYSYKNGVRSSYIQISGKWIKTSQSPYYNLPDNYICHTYSSITEITSYSYMLPFYYLIGVFLSFLVLFFVWFIVKRMFKWRG